MCKAVEHFCIFAEMLDRFSVVFLIKEESCFLSVFDIDHVADTVFFDLHVGIKRFSDKSLVQLHAFLTAYFCIASLIDTADLDAVCCQDFF